jgi:hypothetical protein
MSQDPLGFLTDQRVIRPLAQPFMHMLHTISLGLPGQLPRV